ncbi:MAG: hypothetical protein ABIK37_06615 [candidate division WOR-3 bacterium]
MRVLRLVAAAIDLVVLGIACALLTTKFTVTDFGFDWADVSLFFLVGATAATVVCLRPWAQFRRQPPAPAAPLVGVILNLGFALSFVLAMVRVGEQLSPELLVRLAPFAVVLILDLAALGFRLPGRVPVWLWFAAGLPTIVWAAFYGWPLLFAGLLFGVRPAG